MTRRVIHVPPTGGPVGPASSRPTRPWRHMAVVTNGSTHDRGRWSGTIGGRS